MQFQQISHHRIIVYHFLFYRPDKKTYRCPFAGCNKYQYMKNESYYREFSWKSNLNNHMQIQIVVKALYVNIVRKVFMMLNI